MRNGRPLSAGALKLRQVTMPGAPYPQDLSREPGRGKSIRSLTTRPIILPDEQKTVQVVSGTVVHRAVIATTAEAAAANIYNEPTKSQKHRRHWEDRPLSQHDRASFVSWCPQPSAVGPVPRQPGFLINLTP
jgi:hypothetical protein